MSRGGKDELVERLLSITLKITLPKFLHAAYKTSNVIKQLQQETSNFDHLTRTKALFTLWAPLYDTYWRITNHDTATAECIRQLDVGGTRKGEKVFHGRGLDLGTGTGLVPFLIGRLKEQAILDEMRDNLDDGSLPESSRRLADKCRKLQRDVERFLLEGDPSFLKGLPYVWLEKHLVSKISEDIKAYPVIAQLEQYRRLRIGIDSGVGIGALVNDPAIQNLVSCYIRDATLASSLLNSHLFDEIVGSSKSEKDAFIHDLRTRLNSVISIAGVDICPEMLSIACRRARPIFGSTAKKMFVEADVLNLPENILNTKYDFITVSQLVHLLPDDAKKSFLKICNELLKPDGKLVIIDEWNPIFVGASLLSFDSHQPSTELASDLLFLLSAIEFLFTSVFNPIDKRKFRELIHSAGFVYSTKRATWPIDDVPETLHIQSAHVYLKAKKEEDAVRNRGHEHEEQPPSTEG